MIEAEIKFKNGRLFFDEENQIICDEICMLDACLALPDVAEGKFDRLKLDRPVRGYNWGYRTKSLFVYSVEAKDLSTFIDYDFIEKIKDGKVPELNLNRISVDSGFRILSDKDKVLSISNYYISGLEEKYHMKYYLNEKTGLIYVFAYDEEDRDEDCEDDIKPYFIMAVMMSVMDREEGMIESLEALVNELKTKKIAKRIDESEMKFEFKRIGERQNAGL